MVNRSSKVKELTTISCQWYGLYEAGLKDSQEFRDLEIQVTNLREELRKGKEMSREIAKKWMESEKDSYLSERLTAEDTVEYLVEDANSEAGTDLDDDELEQIAREVLADQLEYEGEGDFEDDDDEDEDDDELLTLDEDDDPTGLGEVEEEEEE